MPIEFIIDGQKIEPIECANPSCKREFTPQTEDHVYCSERCEKIVARRKETRRGSRFSLVELSWIESRKAERSDDRLFLD